MSMNELKKIVEELKNITAQGANAEKEHRELSEAFWRFHREKTSLDLNEWRAKRDEMNKKLNELSYIMRDCGEVAAILRNNARAKMAAACVLFVVGLLQKYAGKAAGEKTRLAFCKDFSAVMGDGWSIYISSRYTLTVYYKYGAGYRDEIAAELLTIDEKEHIKNYINEDNKFTPVFDFSPRNTKPPIKDPRKHIDKMRAAKAELEKAQEAFNAAVEKYNALRYYGTAFASAEMIYKRY